MTDDPGRPTALFLSAHLDDVAFSCGGTVAAFRRRGWRVVVATAFTASVPDPSGFALACQLDKGLAPDVDYLALRRAEDAAFGRAIGVDELIWLGLPEAPHRGYGSASELFGDIKPGDEIADELNRGDPSESSIGSGRRLILAPQAVGGHVDHRQLVRAARRAPADFDGQAGLVSRPALRREAARRTRRPGPPGRVDRGPRRVRGGRHGSQAHRLRLLRLPDPVPVRRPARDAAAPARLRRLRGRPPGRRPPCGIPPPRSPLAGAMAARSTRLSRPDHHPRLDAPLGRRPGFTTPDRGWGSSRATGRTWAGRTPRLGSARPDS